MTPPHHRLLFYAPSLGDGGAERLWAALATQFYLAGHDVTFARDIEVDDCRHLLHDDISVETLGRGHLKSIRTLARLIETKRPHVALTAVAASGSKLLIANALTGSSTEVIQSVHGYNEWKTGFASFLTAVAMPITSRWAARTVAVSTPLRDRLISRSLASRHKTIALPNAVALPNNIPAMTQADLKHRAPHILAVGRLSQDKDYPTLIDAFTRITASGAHLTIVGKGPEHDNLRALIRDHELHNRVTLAGYVKDPSSYYRTATCLALPSRSETFGNVIVEALAFGLPVVATDTDGPRLILNSKKIGMRVPISDPAALAAALQHTLENPGDPRPRQKRAQDFSMERRFQDYQALVNDVVLGRQTLTTKTIAPRHAKETNNVSG